MSSCPLTGIWVRWSWVLTTVTVQNGEKNFYLVLWHTCSREWSVTECLITQSCPTLCDPMDCSLPGSSVHGDSPGKNASITSPIHTGYCFCFGSIPSFFLELFLHWSPVTYWIPSNLGSSSFSILSFCLFTLFMGFSRQEYWSHLPFPSPVDHILSDLSTMTCPSWVAPHDMA